MSTYDVMAIAPCPGFQWLGQPFTSCDRCGKPYWLHSHDERPAASGRRWRRVVIPRAEAAGVQRHWGPSLTRHTQEQP